MRRSLVLTFNDTADLVTISATTSLGDAKAGTPEAARIEEEREALLAGRDEWSMRFANADPESDRVVLQRTHGQLKAVDHIASISPESLQKFFFDTHLTVTFSRREGWAELTIYPGSSERATRQQRQRVDMFGAIFREEKDRPPRISEKERPLVDGVRSAIDTMTSNETDTGTIDRDFDFVFNPFPAELKVVVTGDALAVEGFTKMPEHAFVAKMATALEAVAMLEGRWITPDPLAAAFAAPENAKSEEIAASLAAQPRHAEPVVTASDVASALMEKMRPAPRYRLRWVTKESGRPRPQ